MRSSLALRFLACATVGSLVAASALHRGTGPGVTWEEPLLVANGRGERGEWQQNESRYDHVDDGTVALDDAGNIAVAWVDQGRKDVFFQVFAPDGKRRFERPVNISRTPAVFSWLPRLVIPQGQTREVFVLWQEIIFSGGSHGGEIFFSASRDGGASFGPPLNLSRSTAGDGKGRINREIWHNGSFDLLLSNDGLLHAAWTDYEGALWLASTNDRGASFSKPLRLAGPEPHPVRAPSLATAPEGTLYVAWTLGEDRAADIHVTRSSDGGATFDPPAVVAKTGGYSDAPRLHVGSEGVLHLVFAESEAGPFERFTIQHTRSRDGGRTFGAPRVLSLPHPVASSSASFPGLVVTGDLVAVSWELTHGRGARPRGIGFARSVDGGATFTEPVLIPGSADPSGGFNGSHQGLLMKKLAADDQGRVVLVNSSLKRDAHSRVWLIRGRCHSSPTLGAHRRVPAAAEAFP